jgi:hypothetical protein
VLTNNRFFVGQELVMRTPTHRVGEPPTDGPNDIEMVRALNVVEGDTLDESYAMCKACKTVWMGVGRMRDLRIAHDDRERAKEQTA